MKKIIANILVSAAFLLAALPAVAAPKAEAQFDKLVKSYTLNPDGSQELHVTKQLTIYSHAAMNSLYGETFIVYDPAYQQLRINESYTRQVDGTIVTTPANAFVEVLPSAAANAPAYNGLKEMVVVHTGLELGATIYLDYTITTKAGALPALDVFEQVEELSPIKSYVMSISVPAGTPLHYSLLNGKASPKVSDADGMHTVTWTLKNVAPRPRYLAVSVPAGNVQAVAATTFASPEALASVVGSQVYGPDSQAVKDLLNSMNAGPSDRRSTVDKIHDYLSEELAQSRLTFAQTGYKVRSVEDVIHSAYATDAERTLLANALLRAAGVDSEVLLAFPKASDPLATGYSSLQNIMATGFVDAADGATADISGFLSILSADGQPAVVEPIDRKVVSETTLNVNPRNGKALGGGYYSYALPEAGSGWLGAGYSATTSNTTRPVNLLLPYLPDETYTCTLVPEAGMKAVVLPGQKSVSNPVGSVKITMTENGGKIVVTRSLKLNTQLVTPAMYHQYYQLMADWYEVSVSPVIFIAE